MKRKLKNIVWLFIGFEWMAWFGRIICRANGVSSGRLYENLWIAMLVFSVVALTLLIVSVKIKD